MEKTVNRAVEIVLGLALCAAVVITLVVIWSSFSGAFGDQVKVTAQIGQSGDSLEKGDIVIYRDVVVGEVSSSSGQLNGNSLAGLKLTPSDAKVIPTDVTAVAVPASLFGTEEVELLPPATITAVGLHNGQMISETTSPAATGLQTALTNIYNLITAVHPSQLDAALTALATALQNQGTNIGQLVEQADTYLRKLAPSLPSLDNVITQLATVTDEVAQNAPNLLSSLGHLIVVAQGITAEQQTVADLLNVAPTAVGNAQQLFSAQNDNYAVTIFRNEVPIAQALAANPQALGNTITGFKAFADAFSSAMSGGKLHVTLYLNGINIGGLVPFFTGKGGHGLAGVEDPAQYTAADCPRYIGADGPNCGAAAGTAGESAQLLTTGTAFGGNSSSVGSATELFDVKSAVSSLTGLPASSLPDFVDLLIGPLLRGNPTAILK